MSSGLRARLNAIGAQSPRPQPPARQSGGVARYEHRQSAEPGLFSLGSDGLRRIGWQGRSFDIHRCVFLDTETTGLSGGAGTVAFLLGMGFVDGADFVVEQLLMQDYADEPAMLAMAAQRLKNFDCVCSFNGKNFDLPLLQTRFTMCRMRDQWHEMDQLDLLYPARRTWKMRIGSCRLSRIEEYILGQPRTDDLPGSEAPQRYFDFLRSGDLSLLDPVIDHNRQDIVTLATLLSHLCTLYEHPEQEKCTADLFSMGRALERQGELGQARELYRIAAIPAPAGSISVLKGDAVAARAAWHMYLLARKNRDTESMRAILEQMAVRRQCRDKIYVELSKLHEHRYGNYRRALRYADLAARYASPDDLPALDKRRQRLQNKLNRKPDNNQTDNQNHGRNDQYGPV